MAAAVIALRQPLVLLSHTRPLAKACTSYPSYLLRQQRTPPSPLSQRYISTTRSMSSDSTAAKLSYHVAASFTGKDRPYDPSTHIFHFNPYNRIQQNRSKRSRPDSGHDAFFVSRVGESGSVALGVADGVGGWVDSGVDPADFSHGFCDYMASTAYGHDSIKNDSTKGSGDKDPLRAQALMQTGYQAICEDKTVPAGGSTACVAVASPGGNLDVANLGDSGFIQLRLNAVHTYSEPQTHAFNTPYQLSIVPPAVAARMAAFGGANLCDFPADADVTQHALRHGDIVVFATDGVWDNLFNQDILRIVSNVMTTTGAWFDSKNGVRVVDNLRPFTKPSEDASARPPSKFLTLQSVLAAEITAAAKSASLNRKHDGPFAKGVQKYFPQENWHGGKIDDICVVVLIASDDTKVKSRL